MKPRLYPEYKGSGVPWLEVVPSHWDLLRLGALLRERGETNERGGVTDVLSLVSGRGIIPYDEKGNIGNKKSEDITRYKIVRPNDIVLNSMNVIIGSVGISKYTGCLSPVYYVLKRRSKADDINYLGLIFQIKQFQKSLIRIGKGILAHRMRIPMDLLKCEILPRPPYEEQTQIARFLDWKTAQIDRFIRTKRRLIELLKEQKQALINQAVTGAIDVRTGKPYPEYKDSGVPWLGKVPMGWEIRKFKYLAHFSSGGTPSKSVDSYWDGELPWVSPKDMKNQEIRDAEDHISEQAVQDSATGIAKPGDLLIVVRSGILRRTIPIGIVKRKVSFNQDVKAISPKQNAISSDYLLYLINGCNILLREEWVKVGATVESIEHELMANSYLPVPNLEDQGQIAYYCQRIENSIRKIITRTQHEIDLIQEYRTRLIADVVTGKLDVRDVEVPEVDALESALGEGLITGEAVAQDNLEAAM